MNQHVRGISTFKVKFYSCHPVDECKYLDFDEKEIVAECTDPLLYYQDGDCVPICGDN